VIGLGKKIPFKARLILTKQLPDEGAIFYQRQKLFPLGDALPLKELRDLEDVIALGNRDDVLDAFAG
jgi:hypothetical protein